MALDLSGAGGGQIQLPARQLLARTFKALRHRNFRVYFFGQLISLCGSWMQNIAAGWLVYRLTGSALALALLAGARLLPILLLGLAGGYLSDCLERKKILLTTQSLCMLVAFLLAALTFSGRVEVWQVVSLTLIMGIAGAFDLPAAQAMVADMVPGEEMVNAVSLNALVFNIARTVAPAAAGLAVCWWGEGVCFALNAVSYLASLATLCAIGVISREELISPGSSSCSLKTALEFACSTPQVRAVLCLALVFAFSGMQYIMLLPVFCAQVLHGHAAEYGMLTAAIGLGSLAAALLTANLAKSAALERTIGGAMLGFFLALTAFSFSSCLVLSMFLVLVTAFFAAMQLISSHCLIQLSAPDWLRGKVVSMYFMVSMGAGPLGSLFIGWIEGSIGACPALCLCSVACGLAGSLYFLCSIRRKDQGCAGAYM